jgi:hypothetical protein
MFEITQEIEEHFDSSLRIKAEATVEAIALSKSIQIGEPDQQIELAKASGWGTLTDIWVGANHQGNTWQYRCYERLCQLLTTAEIQAAKSATATAYQTSFEVIRAMWELLAAIGFTGGSILEPACNTLSFMGCQPQNMRIRSQWVGVELDPTFAQIARLLYPEAQIYAQGFEEITKIGKVIGKFYQLAPVQTQVIQIPPRSTHFVNMQAKYRRIDTLYDKILHIYWRVSTVKIWEKQSVVKRLIQTMESKGQKK